MRRVSSSPPVVPTSAPALVSPRVAFRSASIALALSLIVASAVPSALAQPSAPSAGVANEPPPYRLGGYVEAFYQRSFAAPSNHITNARGFDNRSDSFTLSNVALDASWDRDEVIGRLTLQVGHTPSTYYASEPSVPGASAANASDAQLWKFLQQAYAGYRFGGEGKGKEPGQPAFAVTAGLFLSPVGPESIAVHENWSWSRSNLFFGLPFYHTGVRGTATLTDAWSVTLAGYNGWNSVVDDNVEKSLSLQLVCDRARDGLTWAVLYFGGVERPRGAPEGRAWRHLFDTHVTWHAAETLWLRAHLDGGFEPNAFGISAWAAGALHARVRLLPQLFLAARGDVFYERVAENGGGRASPLFWPVPWVSSATGTLDLRPHERVSCQLEYRHDQAGGDLYFGGSVVGDGDAVAFVPNRTSQDTLTVGATTWF